MELVGRGELDLDIARLGAEGAGGRSLRARGEGDGAAEHHGEAVPRGCFARRKSGSAWVPRFFLLGGFFGLALCEWLPQSGNLREAQLGSPPNSDFCAGCTKMRDQSMDVTSPILEARRVGETRANVSQNWYTGTGTMVQPAFPYPG